MKVCIDPGHGGSDPGAIGNGLQEKDITLLIGLKTNDYLIEAGIDVVMTRETDIDVGFANDDATTELAARCAISNNFGADVFLSIHCNSFSDSSVSGLESSYFEGSAKGADLAQCIQAQLMALGGLVNRGINTNELYVTSHTDAIAVLVELAFISNIEDAAKLGNSTWQDKFAGALARGITDYQEIDSCMQILKVRN